MNKDLLLKKSLTKKLKTLKSIKFNQIELKKNKDELFFDFLRTKDKIKIFEVKKQTIFTKNYYRSGNSFYLAYQRMKEEIKYMGYLLPKIVFIELYKKANIMKQRIKRYSKNFFKPTYEVTESFNPKYWQNSEKHNWERSPLESYNIFLKNKKKENHKNNKENTELTLDIVMNEKPDLIVVTEHSNKYKNLIYFGKLCNVYVRNEINDNKKNSISMATDYNCLKNKEYIYNKLNIPKFLCDKEKENNNSNLKNNKNRVIGLKQYKSFSKLNRNSELSNCNESTYFTNNNNKFKMDKIFKTSFIRNKSNLSENLQKFKKINLLCLKKFGLNKNDFFY